MVLINRFLFTCLVLVLFASFRGGETRQSVELAIDECSTSFPYDPFESIKLSEKGKYSHSFKKKVSMPFSEGEIFASPIHVEQQQIVIKDFIIFTSGEWDSVEVRISVLDTSQFFKHSEKSQSFTVTNKRIQFKDLNLTVANQRGRYLMVFEVVAIHGKANKSFSIEGGETKEPSICYLKKPVHYGGSEDIYQVMWFEHPVWQPKIKVVYLID